jgi:Holliday junction resolvase RusA-like endonuclease
MREVDGMTMIEFTVYGKPATAGSKQAFPFKRKDGTLGVRVTSDNQRYKPWRQSLIDAAVEAGPIWFDESVALIVNVIRPRPKGHFRTGKNSEQVRDSAEPFPTTKPDTVKIVRAVEDSLTGIVWRDDSQVVRHFLTKDYGEPERVEITILSFENDESFLRVVADKVGLVHDHHRLAERA